MEEICKNCFYYETITEQCIYYPNDAFRVDEDSECQITNSADCFEPIE